MDTHPRRRALEVIPLEAKGQRAVALRDPADHSRQPVILTAAAFLLWSMCDGEHTVRDLQVELTRRVGELVMSSTIEAMLREFDDNLLMDTPTYHDYVRGRLEAYRQRASRPAIHAGGGYPADPKELARLLDGLLDSAPPFPGLPADVMGLIAPHIDLARGGPVYGSTYAALRQSVPEARRFVVLGIAHHATQTPLVLTRVPYETPLGRCTLDAAFIDSLALRCSQDLFADELAHESEHSIEFTALFLNHIYGPDVTLVPILCGSFEPGGGEGESPADLGPVRECVEALAAGVAEADGPTCVIAAVDFSHIGPQFGDPRPATPAFVEWAEARDQQLLNLAAAGDAEGFYAAAVANDNESHVCGVPAIYMLLAALAPVTGVLIDHAHAVTDETRSAVTFAGMVLAKA
ncbi:MAG TPA: AmmeMemoRadiSam system protein B [Armatimonadota bacterium]|nr:AmmeMemoRadiSam system protein B [Armatimonadota bacterium]HQK95543.1 AmmeMemoRadiSam system protein B [Armatimonadota bacterium]